MDARFSPFHCLPVTVPVQTSKDMHSHEMHEFFLCTNSLGSQFAGSKEIPNKKDHLFCFPEGQRHYCSGLPGRPSKGYVFMVPDNMFSQEAYGDRETHATLQLLIAMARQGKFPLPLGRATSRMVHQLVAKMVREYRGSKTAGEASVRSCLQEIFVKIMRDPAISVGAKRASFSDPYDEKMASLFGYLDTRFMDKVPVEKIIKMMGMSRSRFHLVFKARAGCTLVEYLTRTRIRAAQRLLRESDLPIAQIAMDCGFSTLSRFYEAFRAATGKSPRRLRIS